MCRARLDGSSFRNFAWWVPRSSTILGKSCGDDAEAEVRIERVALARGNHRPQRGEDEALYVTPRMRAHSRAPLRGTIHEETGQGLDVVAAGFD